MLSVATDAQAHDELRLDLDQIAAIDEARVLELVGGLTPTQRHCATLAEDLVKSLVLMCDGSPVMALIPGDRRADTRRIARAAGVRQFLMVPICTGTCRLPSVIGVSGACVICSSCVITEVTVSVSHGANCWLSTAAVAGVPIVISSRGLTTASTSEATTRSARVIG